MGDLGGTAELVSAPGQGTEWELSLPREPRVTIHSDHPFREPTPEPARQLRARLGGAVSLWTAGSGASRAGLTVSSLMVAGGDPGRLLALLDPDSDLRAELGSTGRGVVHLLRWGHRQLAEAFAGQFPAPGGPFTLGEWEQTSHGPAAERRSVAGPRSRSSPSSPSAGPTSSSPASSRSPSATTTPSSTGAAGTCDHPATGEPQ